MQRAGGAGLEHPNRQPKQPIAPRALAVILLVFLALVTYYNASIPLYESPDELQHVAFVAWLADSRALPVLDPENAGPWLQEGTQPPLYYWIAARLASGLPHAEADRLATPNPYANLGDPLRPGNKNVVLHDPDQEGWPYTGSVLFVHLLRAISSCMALGTLLAVYRLGRMLFPERPGIALGMTGFVAFIPQFLFLSASVNNDNLVILIASWTLVLLVSWLRAPRLPNGLQLSSLGVLLGLGALSKTSGLLLWPLAASVLIWQAWRFRRWRWLIAAGAGVFAIALALSGWWFVRNWRLYGEMTGIGPHLRVMERRQSLPSTLPGLLAEFRGFRYSFWSLFGFFSILAPEPFYWVLDGLTVLGLAGFGLFVGRELGHRPGWLRAAFVTLVAWCGLMAIGVVRWTLLTPASQGRLLYPALAPIALFLVVGWAEWVPTRLRRPICTVALSLWGLWAALCPFLVLRPAYALPERVHSLDQLPAQPAALGVRFDACCELVGYYLSDKTLDGPVHAGDWVPLTLIWRVLNRVDENYSLSVAATSAVGQVVGQVDTYPGSGMYPTSLWHPGEIIADTIQVPISWAARGPTLVRFDVGLYELATMERLPATLPDSTSALQVMVGEVALAPREWPKPVLNAPTQALFGQRIRLTGVDLHLTARPGDVVTVTLQWESLDRIDEDYTGFVHLVDVNGQDVAQDDHLPLDGQYPTRVWYAGTVVSDPYRLQLPGDLPEGNYELWGGLYQLGSGRRVPAWAEDGSRWKDDLVFLGSLEVTREP